MKIKRKIIENYIIDNKERLYRIAYAYVRNKDDALDIFQDSALKALKSYGSLKNSDNIKTWYYRIITNTAIDFMRKNNKFILIENEDLISECKYDNYENIDLKRALYLLSYEQRVVVTLRFFEDMKIQDIADITGENLSTVKSRLYKALKVLKINLTEDNDYDRQREN